MLNTITPEQAAKLHKIIEQWVKSPPPEVQERMRANIERRRKALGYYICLRI